MDHRIDGNYHDVYHGEKPKLGKWADAFLAKCTPPRKKWKPAGKSGHKKSPSRETR